MHNEQRTISWHDRFRYLQKLQLVAASVYLSGIVCALPAGFLVRR